MLKRLYISNYALIDSLEVTLDKGLTIITGETGAGKSIVLGALALILGERADTRVIRRPESKTVVEATFDISTYQLETFFEQADLDYDTECILRRELSGTGRSRAFVNDTPVSLALMRSLASELVDIHSQHSNMLLAQPAYQLSVLDSIAENQTVRDSYNAAYKAFVAALAAVQQLQHHLDDTRKEEDYLRFQLDQFHSLALKEGEDEELEQEQSRLANVSELKQTLWDVDRVMNGGDMPSVLEQLRDAAHWLHRIEDKLPAVAELAQRVDSALIELKDVNASLSSEQMSLVDDPSRLEQVEQRLSAIYDLQRKHGVADFAELLRIQSDLERRLNALDAGDQRLNELTAEVEARRSEVEGLAATLTETRRAAALTFTTEVLDVARNLGLPNLRFEVTLSPVPPCATGADEVAFMMSFNRKQALMPVGDTASGGEISRVMLAVKSVVARRMNLPTIIFDEVDTGVSGDIATMMGEQMAAIARQIQVLAITHLPQVAAHAASHLRVFKTDTDAATNTHIERLSPDEHVLEIARLLSGRSLNQAAIDNAKSLINSANHSAI